LDSVRNIATNVQYNYMEQPLVLKLKKIDEDQLVLVYQDAIVF